MKIRIDYLNKDREVRHSFMNAKEDGYPDAELLGLDILDLLEQWATDMHIYKL